MKNTRCSLIQCFYLVKLRNAFSWTLYHQKEIKGILCFCNNKWTFLEMMSCLLVSLKIRCDNDIAKNKGLESQRLIGAFSKSDCKEHLTPLFCQSQSCTFRAYFVFLIISIVLFHPVAPISVHPTFPFPHFLILRPSKKYRNYFNFRWYWRAMGKIRL